MSESSTGQAPRLTVGIPTYNGRELLEVLLPSLAQQRPGGFRTVVVDDASSDGTVEWLHECWPQVEVIAHTRNRGVTAALNSCLRATDTDMVALLNNDVELDPDCLQRLLEELEQHPAAAVVGAKLVDYHDRDLLDGAGDIYTWGGEGHRRGQGQRDHGQYERAEEVFSVCAAAAMYRRTALEEVGPFDERFFANQEDIDWCFRANLAGWRCRYVPQAVAFHMGSATLGREISDFSLFHNWRNGIWVVCKNYPGRALVRHLPDLAFVQARNLAVAIRDRRAPVWLRAWSSALRGMPETLAERRRIQGSRSGSVSRLEALIDAGDRVAPATLMSSVSLGVRSRRLTGLVRKALGAHQYLLFGWRRRRLANRYISGSGLEIGALHRPLKTPVSAHVRYVDRMDTPSLRSHYRELAGEKLVEVDVIDNGEELSTQAEGSVDFIIANHFIEHTEDPLGTLENHLRVLRPGGVLYLAVPDRRRTFDVDRSPTPLSHLVDDHRLGPNRSRRVHQEEWARLVEKVPPEQVEDRVQALEETDYSIHFHVWAPEEFTELLRFAREQQGLPFQIEKLQPNHHEFIAILRRV